jgi:hypothetical protein
MAGTSQTGERADFHALPRKPYLHWFSYGHLRLRVGCMRIAGGCSGGRARIAAAADIGGNPKEGLELLRRRGCITCRRIFGVREAGADVGLPPARIANRSYRAGRLENAPENMDLWIRTRGDRRSQRNAARRCDRLSWAPRQVGADRYSVAVAPCFSSTWERCCFCCRQPPARTWPGRLGPIAAAAGPMVGAAFQTAAVVCARRHAGRGVFAPGILAQGVPTLLIDVGFC